MLRGFIVGLIVGLAALAGLMVLFPLSVEAPGVPETGAMESGAPAGAETEGAMEGAGEAPAVETSPEPGAAPSAPAGEGAAPGDQTQAPVETPVVATDASEPSAATVVADATGPEPTAEPVTENAAKGGLHLPTLVRPEDSLKAPVAGPEGLPAWRRNAVAFDDSDDRPLLSVVLTAMPDGAGATTPLSEIDAPLTLAVPPTSRAGANAARLYRKAGYETLLLLSFSPSAGGGIAPGLSDAEVAEAVRALIDSFDSVVGVANPGAPKNTEMRIARVVMRELAAGGLGYLHGDGAAIGAEVRAAEESGVPLARHVRVIGAGLSVPEVLKALDFAAFDARRRGAAVAMGAPTEAMVQALKQWAKDNDGRAARLAPFSAVLARLARAG